MAFESTPSLRLIAAALVLAMAVPVLSQRGAL